MFKRNRKPNRSQQLKNESMASLVVPLVFSIIGFITSVALSATAIEGLILSMSLGIYSAILSQYYNNMISDKSIVDNLSLVQTKLDELVILSQIQERINTNSHPYFKKQGYKKIFSFLNSNSDFFSGTYRTHPHAEDTFGIDGIKYTNFHGTLKCTSVIQDYWEDSFVSDYLEQQRLLICDKKVRIQRIFFMDSSQYENKFAILNFQHEIGIEVFYIFTNDEYLNPEWIEDFLIQDNRLLVQIFCDNHKFDPCDLECELITTNASLVESKVERFDRLLERAKKFTAR